MSYTGEFFDEYLDRRGTNCFKWDGIGEKFGVKHPEEIIPMWIADMDFRSPREVIDTIVERAQAQAYGYTIKKQEFFDAIIQWVDRHYHWKIEKDWIVFTPGVIPGFYMAIQQFTKPGEGVIVQTPVYYPFMEGVENNDRKLVRNPLIEKDGYWTMDFEDLERKAQDPANKLMIISNPHNPVGRAWTVDELEKLVDICERNHVIVVSDEIHADLMMDGHEHHALCAVSEKARKFAITQYAPSKTFNLAGLQTSYAVIPDAQLREAFLRQQTANRLGAMNWFGAAALVTAYTKCDDYVTALCDYVSANMDYMVQFLKERLPELKMTKPEATYMVWVDFRGTGMSTEEIEKFILEKAHIATDMGSWFRDGGEGYLRFNLACPRSILEKALAQLEKALHA